MLAFVLVGESTRLPGKHFLQVVRGKRLIDLVIDNLRSIGFRVVIYSRVPFETDAELILDRTSWILESIHSLFDYEDEFFLFGGDMPLVKKRAVELMVESIKPLSSLVPRWRNGYLEPLHAYYHHSTSSCLRGESLTSALRACRYVEYIPAEIMPEETFFNINTRDDFEKFRKMIAEY